MADTIDAQETLKMLQVFVREAIDNEDPQAVQGLLLEMHALAQDALDSSRSRDPRRRAQSRRSRGSRVNSAALNQYEDHAWTY